MSDHTIPSPHLVPSSTRPGLMKSVPGRVVNALKKKSHIHDTCNMWNHNKHDDSHA